MQKADLHTSASGGMPMHDLEVSFPGSLATLRGLFGSQLVAEKFPRLKDIYDYTEAAWLRYAGRVGSVRFVMIAEAPPWCDAGTPRYVLDPQSPDGPYSRALRRAFPGADRKLWSDTLDVLSGHGFLLLDSIPFAMNYSSKRRSPKYDHLVRHAVTEYVQRKLSATHLAWSPEVRIAFAARLNGLAVLQALPQLSLGGRVHSLSREMIAVNMANYPDAWKLGEIYGFAKGDRE